MRKTSLESVFHLAKLDKRVLFIGSDLGSGVLDDMKFELPKQWFMEGVSEQHIIGMAAGLAMEGFIPYVNTISTFITRRCYEQVVVDLSLHELPVRLIGNGGGLVYAPLGPTHQAIEDLGIMRIIPNMTVIAPCDAVEMRHLMNATLNWPGPIYIRLGKGGDRIISDNDYRYEIGKGVLFREPRQILFVTTGVMAQRALDASDLLVDQGIVSGVLHLHTVKPLDHQLLLASMDNVELVVTLEEHLLEGGLGAAVLETVSDRVSSNIPRIKRLGILGEFTKGYGSQDSLLASLGLDPASIADAVKEILFVS